MHEIIQQFCEYLRKKNKYETLRGYSTGIILYSAWLLEHGIDPLSVTTDQIKAFQRWLAMEYRSKNGKRLSTNTLATRMSAIKAFYAWLFRRGQILIDPGKKIKLPKYRRGMVKRDHLDLQESMALLQTQADVASRHDKGSVEWAREIRSLAILTIAIATGRRKSGIRDLKVSDINLKRNELRCSWEKGKAGRVLPVKQWAIDIVSLYLDAARSLLPLSKKNKWLFPGDQTPRIGKESMRRIISRVHSLTVEENPDLDELSSKNLTPHGLRVSFATLLFEGGCNIRSVNELMLHDRLSTTARYTPIPLEDLRRVCRQAHPRA